MRCHPGQVQAHYRTQFSETNRLKKLGLRGKAVGISDDAGAFLWNVLKRNRPERLLQIRTYSVERTKRCQRH